MHFFLTFNKLQLTIIMKSIFIFPGEVIRLPKGASIPVTLKVLEFELFHFCPIQVRHHNQLMLYVTGY